MRILELEIFDTRGIRELALRLEGKNVVICGQNGSGKSGVVDALDFLLTGEIARLSGAGTKDISIAKHGHHISAQPDTARVRAKVKLHTGEIVTIERAMDDPKHLVCDPEEAKTNLEPIMSLAAQRQHVLTRREILKYITAPASDRAQQIQQLLAMEEIEELRKKVVRVETLAQDESKIAKRSYTGAESRVAAAAGQSLFDGKKALASINEQRAILGAPIIEVLSSAHIKVGISPLGPMTKNEINPDVIAMDFENLTRLSSAEMASDLHNKDEELRSTLELIRSNPRLLHDISHKPLLEIGKKLIDDTGVCPLCDKEWPPGKLLEHVDEKLTNIEAAQKHQRTVSMTSDFLSRTAQSIAAGLARLVEAATAVNLPELPTLQVWADDLAKFSESLKEPIETYPLPRFGPDAVKEMLAPRDFKGIFEKLQKLVEAKFPRVAQKATALEKLTRFEEAIKTLEEAEKAQETATCLTLRAQALLETFYRARDAVLRNLFESIAKRFAELYRKLHEHEGVFDAELKLEDAGLKLQVDFYGKGKHPPHALHSEGHQDSMGVCLYLTLAERLTKGVIDLLILDDVVMSVDSLHRRQLCELLKDYFSDRQFIITTHDWVWAYQLKTTGIVSKKRLVEFYDWDIELGPKVNYETDMWVRIEKDLQKGDVPTAAARLRRGSEQFFAIVCDNLTAPVPFKLDGRVELGDLINAAKSQLQKLISDAIQAANSWGQSEKKNKLVLAQSAANKIFERFKQEQGSVNILVHFNDWANLSTPDFKPVVNAFKELYSVFLCPKCSPDGGELKVEVTNKVSVGVSCDCGEMQWNLKQKMTAESRISGFAQVEPA
jgi:recombinational DNA repair ATPase RecF